MKKQLVALISALVLVCLLTGCGAVQQTEVAIEAIGTVTLDSLGAIENAEALFNELEDKQSKVENAAVLKAARSEYDRLVKLIADADVALAAIANVTPATGDAIAAAWSAYEALEADGLTQQFPGMLQTLRDAEAEFSRQQGLIDEYTDALEAIGTVTLDSKAAISATEKAFQTLEKNGLDGYVSKTPLEDAINTYEQLFIKSCYDSICDLYNSGKYSDARDAIVQLNTVYPNHKYIQNTNELNAKCYIAEARDIFNQGGLETAQAVLTLAEQHGSNLTEYKDLVQQMQDQLASMRPANGESLFNNLDSSYCTLTIISGSTDVCVKLESVDNPEKYHMFYVHANSEVTVSVPSGNYNFKYVTGRTWYGEENMFGTSSSYSRSEDPIEFELTYSGNYVNYTTMTITLYSVIGGNFDTDSIGAEDF